MERATMSQTERNLDQIINLAIKAKFQKNRNYNCVRIINEINKLLEDIKRREKKEI